VKEVRAYDKLISVLGNLKVDPNYFKSAPVSHLDQSQENNAANIAGLSPEFRKDIETAVSMMRLNPHYIGDALLRGSYLRGAQSPHLWLCQALVVSLFGNCFTPTDEKLLLYLIQVKMVNM
jgi:hypothetical protein